MDNTNHDLIHTLSVRLDTRWHHQTYEDEVNCPGCRRIFERLKELDDEAISLLAGELAEHVHSGRFPAGPLERAQGS